MLTSLIRSQMQAGAVDLVHLPGRSVLEPFQPAVCKGEWSYCSCGMYGAHVCGLLGWAGGFFPIPWALWLFHAHWGFLPMGNSPSPCGYSMGPLGTAVVPPPSASGTIWHQLGTFWLSHLAEDIVARRRERECCSAGTHRAAAQSRRVPSKADNAESRQCDACWWTVVWFFLPFMILVSVIFLNNRCLWIYPWCSYKASISLETFSIFLSTYIFWSTNAQSTYNKSTFVVQKIMLYLFQNPNTALERDLKSIWSTWKGEKKNALSWIFVSLGHYQYHISNDTIPKNFKE